jgi:EF-hand domain pair
VSLGFSQEEAEMAFRAFDTNNDGSVTFKELFVGYAITFGGSVDDKIQMCFRAFDREGDDRLSEEEIEELISFLYQISSCADAGVQTVRRRKRFSRRLVRAAHETDARALNLKQFREVGQACVCVCVCVCMC